MCIAIWQPVGKSLTEEILRNAWQQCSDGAGMAYINDGEVVISKGYMKCKEFLEAYQTAVKTNPKSPFILHFRIKTMGDKVENNTHPFKIKDGALAHNGSFRGTGAGNTGNSDTAIFAREFGEDLTYENISADKRGFEDDIDTNKVVMLWNTGKHIILNESLGSWVNGVWFSTPIFPSNQRGRAPMFGTD